MPGAGLPAAGISRIEGETVLFKILVATAASLMLITGALSQDGARAYHLVPAGTDIASLTATFVHAELNGSVFDVGVVTPTYRGSFDLLGNSGAFLIGMPIGSLSASIDTGQGILDVETDPAQGDLFVGGVWGFLGSPSLSPMDYAQYKPGLRASVAAKLFLPTGDYDSSRLLNLGGNRWSLQASLPFSYVLGDTMIDPDLTTFEIMPVVQIFGDNNDPFVPATVTSQDPVWGVEGHITRTFTPTVWAALDGYYEFGGETSADGVPRGDAQEVLSLGATLGLVLSPAVALRLSYDEVVYASDPDTAGRHLEITSAYSF